MKKIAKITEIEPQESKCIITGSERKLFRVNNTPKENNANIKNNVHNENNTNIENSINYLNNNNNNNDRESVNGVFTLDSGGTLKTSNSSFVSHNSVLQRSIIFSCILRPESWFFVGIDLKMVELTQYVAYSNVVLGVAITLENALEVLRFAQQTMMSRYDMMSKLGVSNFLDLPEKGRALMVMIDEYGEAASPTGSKTEEGKEADAMKGEIQMIVGSIARLGRAAGVHLVIATQRPDAKMLPGETKDLDVTTKIITDNGWKTMGEIEIGDKVFDEKGNKTTVVNMTEYMYGNKIYKINFSTGESIKASATHKWPILNINTKTNNIAFTDKNKRNIDNTKLINIEENDNIENSNHKIMTTQEIFSNMKESENKKYALQITQPLNTEDKKLPIDPWILGFWLGKESSTNNYLENVGNKTIEKIKKLGYEVKENNTKKSYQITQLIKELKENNILDNKHIPNDYILSSINQRKTLLSGLLDSNGTISEKQVTFTHNNKNIAEGVLFLVRSLGYKAYIDRVDNNNSSYKTSVNKEYWRVIFTTNDKVLSLDEKNTMFSLGNNDNKAQNYHYIETIEEVDTVPTKCIQVDNDSHTYLAGESLIPTHNSNLGARINCGYANPIASSMILDNAEGTKIKPNPKGRFYIRIYSQGNHGQAFFAKGDWMDKYLESQGLNADGTPKGSTSEGTSAIEEAANSAGGAELKLKDEEDGDGKYDRPEDDWDDELDELISENSN